MYSLSGHGKMIGDRVRMGSYARALRRVVKPGSVILDVGTGTGIFAVLASRLGARKVYSVEPGDVIEVARAIAAANGCSGKIEFIQARSTEVTLPERADVIISDLRGVLPLFQHHITDIADARRRLLADGGQLIPRTDTLWAAVVESPEFYGSLTEVWEGNEYGLDMGAARRIAVNSWYKTYAKPDQLLVEPQLWGTLDYGAVESPRMDAELEWAAHRGGTAHGLVLWFDTVLTDGVTFSNSPASPELIYGSAFFPLTKPVTLARGDTVSVSLRAQPVGDDYVWVWETRVREAGGGGGDKAAFKQSTFYGELISSALLAKQRETLLPSPGS
jgi:type I protein arginine methyltransferase